MFIFKLFAKNHPTSKQEVMDHTSDPSLPALSFKGPESHGLPSIQLQFRHANQALESKTFHPQNLTNQEVTDHTCNP